MTFIWWGLFQEEWHSDSGDCAGDWVMRTQWSDADVINTKWSVSRLQQNVHLEWVTGLCHGWQGDVQGWYDWCGVSPDKEVVVLPAFLCLHLPHGHLLRPLRQGRRSSLLQKGGQFSSIVSLVILWLFKKPCIAKFNFKLSYFQINSLLIMAFIANWLFEK